jgi:hypothetical protein
VSFTASRPRLPVKALALPELTTSALAMPCSSLERHHSTGADAVFDLVSTPATVVPGSNSASRRSVRPGYRMPAAQLAKRTPSMAGRCGSTFGANGETLPIKASRPEIRAIPQ